MVIVRNVNTKGPSWLHTGKPACKPEINAREDQENLSARGFSMMELGLAYDYCGPLASTVRMHVGDRVLKVDSEIFIFNFRQQGAGAVRHAGVPFGLNFCAFHNTFEADRHFSSTAP